MTVTTTIATCPTCGDYRETIFVRSDDGSDLVCRSQACREGGSTPEPQSGPLPTPSRRIFSRRR